jgi:YesN/AraC family two-component response regulator
MISILFVDDEPNILQGLQRMLRHLRHQWAMDFAVGGFAALDALSKAHYDIIVTDMRMPGMSGAQLLVEASRVSSAKAYIVLSGQTEVEHLQLLSSVPHIYLSKPCNAETLYETISSLSSKVIQTHE